MLILITRLFRHQFPVCQDFRIKRNLVEIEPFAEPIPVQDNFTPVPKSFTDQYLPEEVKNLQYGIPQGNGGAEFHGYLTVKGIWKYFQPLQRCAL